MGSIESYFDFDGRLDRLGFLWRGAVVVAVVVVLASYGRRALSLAIGSEGLLGVRTWAEWSAVAVVLAAFWSMLSLAVRRLRDMGAEPAWVAPVGGFLASLACLLGGPMIRFAPAPLDEPAPAALALLAALAAPLCLWPGGAAKARSETPSFEPDVPTAYVDWREGSLRGAATREP